MAIDLPTRARVVIVGGGVIGCSVAYHLSQARLERHRAPRAQTAHLGHHLACRGPHRPIAPEHQHDEARALHGGAVSRPRGRDRPGDRLPPVRLDLPGDHRGSHGGAQAQRLHGEDLRAARSCRESGARSDRSIPWQSGGCDRRHSHPERRLRQCGGYHAGARQRRPRARREDFSGYQSHRDPPRRQTRERRGDRARTRSMPTTWCSAGACGLAIWRRASA